MSTSIFPLTAPRSSAVSSGGFPMYREVKWDFSANRPVYAHGEPVVVTGAEAVLTWAWNALHVKRGLFEALSPEYGSDIYTLTGKPYTEATRNAEAVRYIRECLEISPYIREVRRVSVSFEGTELRVSFALLTIYGEVTSDGVLS